MIRPGLSTNTTTVSLLSGNVTAATTGTDYATVDYTGIAYISCNPAVTTTTDTADSPTCIITLKTGTDTALTVPTTLKTFATSDTATATLESFELDMQLSKGYLRCDVAVTDTANATCPVSVVALFPNRNW